MCVRACVRAWRANVRACVCVCRLMFVTLLLFTFHLERQTLKRSGRLFYFFRNSPVNVSVLLHNFFINIIYLYIYI